MASIAEKRVKTRKIHPCRACGAQLAAGSTVERTVNADDGRIYSSYWCGSCVKFMCQMDPWDLEDGFNFDIWEYDGYTEFLEAEGERGK